MKKILIDSEVHNLWNDEEDFDNNNTEGSGHTTDVIVLAFIPTNDIVTYGVEIPERKLEYVKQLLNLMKKKSLRKVLW